ncbi:hypothetical protein MHK72_12805, partial [Salinicoccus roseus]|nr:hypothetical protein [Salinicoccus roseus]
LQSFYGSFDNYHYTGFGEVLPFLYFVPLAAQGLRIMKLIQYLKKLDKAKHSDDPYTDDFSHPFLVSTIKKLIQQDDWYEAFDIVKIDLADTNYQVIYED